MFYLLSQANLTFEHKSYCAIMSVDLGRINEVILNRMCFATFLLYGNFFEYVYLSLKYLQMTTVSYSRI